MTTFLEKLEAASQSRRSLLCIGLDPDPQRMPAGVYGVFDFNRAIIDATADLVCAYKPNLAFYEALGLDGLKALKETVEYIREVAGDVFLIGDGKRGDVGNTAEAYARALFQVWGFDAATVNAYGGHDTLRPFLDHPGKGVFIWCRSSNPGAGDLQDLKLTEVGKGQTVYEGLAHSAREWNDRGNIGLVIGATYPQELKEVREICPDMPFLIPGVGAQGGGLEEAVRLGTDGRGRQAIINSSRQVVYASGGADFAQAARREAMRIRDEINHVLEQEGKGWY